jgi:hypothetical protein
MRCGERTQERLVPGRLGSPAGFRLSLKSRLWSFGNSVRQHEAHSTRGSRTINDDVTAFQPGAFAPTAAMGR